jgi:hypothetical protein
MAAKRFVGMPSASKRRADVVEKPFDISVQYPVHRPILDANRERPQRSPELTRVCSFELTR